MDQLLRCPSGFGQTRSALEFPGAGLCAPSRSNWKVSARNRKHKKVSTPSRIITASQQADAPTEPSTVVARDGVLVRFTLKRQCHFGQKFYVTGDDQALGQWELKAAWPMEWREGHVWSVVQEFPVGFQSSFKFVLIGKRGEIMWQPGQDRVLNTSGLEPGTSVHIQLPWDDEEVEPIGLKFFELSQGSTCSGSEEEASPPLTSTSSEEEEANEKIENGSLAPVKSESQAEAIQQTKAVSPVSSPEVEALSPPSSGVLDLPSEEESTDESNPELPMSTNGAAMTAAALAATLETEELPSIDGRAARRDSLAARVFEKDAEWGRLVFANLLRTLGRKPIMDDR